MEEKRKLRVGIVSNSPVNGKTGLSRNQKAILPLLYKSDKYELFFLAQGIPDNDINFQRLPFKVEGVFKNFDQNRFNQDPNYQRIISYGSTAVEGFVTNNKLDCLILSDDQWAYPNEFYLNTDWFNHMKKNIMPVITADSEPLLSQIVEWAEKCENMTFWTTFAERILKQKDNEKFKHCKTIYGALNTDDFKPISKIEKFQLRKKFNIQDDEKIVIYLGRNQLRKIFGSHIEGLAKFRKRHPNKKLRLLFHCQWSEPSGWPLNQIREQNGLKKEDILATYYCKNCADWNVQPFEGEDLDCPHCKGQKCRNTAGVGSTITEEDLNKIYNICDGSASIFTSGAFEFTNAESMLSGIPLACPNYVCGEDFISSGHVYQIKGTYTFEHNTGFKKFVPDINSVCDFFEFIHDLPENKRKEITEKGRKWAVENFDAKNVVKKYEEFLDSCQPIDWDVFFNKKKELRNTNAQIEDKPNDEEFILECYTKILGNPDVKNNDSNGFNYWKQFLGQARDKNQLKNEMVGVFRNAAQDHNKKVQPNNTLEDLLIKNDKKHFLLVCPQSGGDILYASSLLKSLRESYKSEEWNIYFACQPEFQELLELNPNIDKILNYQPFMDNEIAMLGQGNTKGPFQGFSFLTVDTQKFLSYLGNHNLNIKLKD